MYSKTLHCKLQQHNTVDGIQKYEIVNRCHSLLPMYSGFLVFKIVKKCLEPHPIKHKDIKGQFIQFKLIHLFYLESLINNATIFEIGC